MKRIKLDGDALVFRVFDNGVYADCIYVRSKDHPYNNNCFERCHSYREFIELSDGFTRKRGGFEMKDIAEGQVALYKLQVRNEELIAYMKPTPEQHRELNHNLVQIANIALQMHDLIKGD